MAIQGVSADAIPFILERERGSNATDPTVFHILPKSGHEQNLSMRRYAQSRRDGRKGASDWSANKLDEADRLEFNMVVQKVENYIFGTRFYPDMHKKGLIREITDEKTLSMVAQDMDSDALTEVFDAANNMDRLLPDGDKKNSNCLSISPSGSPKSDS